MKRNGERGFKKKSKDGLYLDLDSNSNDDTTAKICYCYNGKINMDCYYML